MIEKGKNNIMHSLEDKVLNINKKDIEQYLSEVKEAVENDRYRLDRNAKRQDNINLFLDYVIDEAKAKEITHTSHTKIRHTTRNYATLGIWKRFFQFSGSLLIKRDTSSAIWHSDAL